MIPRPRKVVWEELAAGDHPAWTEPVSNRQQRRLSDGALEVGAVTVTGPIAMPPFGLRAVWWTEVTAIVPGWSVTTDVYAGFFEHTEMLLLEDHADGTYARIEGSLRRATTPEGADHAAVLMTRLAVEYLRRPAEWKPGDEPRPVLLRPPGF